MSHLSFPQAYKGLDFVYSFKNIGCYSDKELEESDGSTVNFKDGSVAELSSRRVVNRGAGKILLRSLDETFVTEVTPSNFSSLTDTKYDCEFKKVKDLQCFIPNGNCVINKIDGDKTTVHIEGYPEFIDLFEFEYKDIVENGKMTEAKLKIDYDRKRRDELNNEINKWDISKNIVNINLAYDGETLENLGLTIDGSGDVKLNVPSVNAGLNINGSGAIASPVSFVNLGATINGSGNITFSDAVNLSATINGSGDIDFSNAVNYNFSINGSGDINFNDAVNGTAAINGSGDISGKKMVNLAAKIHGSGDMKFHECDVIAIEIHGSGDFDTDKINKAVEVKIHGSGDVNIKNGEAETFNVYIDNGEVRAKGVTADRANIEIPNNGKVEIGRVKIESIEKCGDNAEVIIHQRG